MSALQEFLWLAAAHLPLWRDAAIVVLAGIVIGALWFYAEASGS